MKVRHRRRLLTLVLALAPLGAADGPRPVHDLGEASLEDLMNIEVTTVSRKEQRFSRTPAAVFVITQEDIRRSGMTNIPDLLRMVPGVQVGQAQGGQWAVSARGFNDSFSNKLLVLVDGRSVYSPINSGVFWDEQDLFLANIERIEVIRGPGATLWGANAVNGVINVITKSARDTQGALGVTGVGNEGQSLAGVRFGGNLGADGHYRVSTKYLHGRALQDATSLAGIGGQSSLTAGMRADWSLSARDSLTVEGDAFRSSFGWRIEPSRVPAGVLDAGSTESSGGSLMANWNRNLSERSKTELRVSYSNPGRSAAIGGDRASILDLDFQHALTLSGSHELVWGLGFRDASLQTSQTAYISFSPSSRNDALFSGFVQDQWAVVPNSFYLILGAKLEHNAYTGVEIQPGARILWTPDSRHTLWAAASRAIREPAMFESDVRLNTGSAEGPNGIPIQLELLGSPSFRSESALTYELGYRLQTTQRISVDVAAHRTAYTHLRTAERGAPILEPEPSPHLTVQTRFANLMRGEAKGIEIATSWKLTERWRIIPSYSWLDLDARLDAGSNDTVSRNIVEGQSPRHQFQFRSNLDISRKLQLDGGVYYTGALPKLAIPAYTRVDARLGYRPRPEVEVSLAAANLQGGRHVEFLSAGPYSRATIGRSFLMKLTWGF